ncbi:hypothetical protein [Paracoccus sp. SSK6]|uniref:hypothetical protein n=1 Tax=Paracoccus sp. SSK6 TaxID=3143131 RepID=UPI00321AD597
MHSLSQKAAELRPGLCRPFETLAANACHQKHVLQHLGRFGLWQTVGWKVPETMKTNFAA